MAREKSSRHRRTGDRDSLVRLRAICLALPEAKEKLSHGEPTWFAGKGKVFAMLDDHHHGAPHPKENNLRFYLTQRPTVVS